MLLGAPQPLGNVFRNGLPKRDHYSIAVEGGIPCAVQVGVRPNNGASALAVGSSRVLLCIWLLVARDTLTAPRNPKITTDITDDLIS